MSVQDRVAIVTGAARGIGAATAGLLAKGGAKVVVTDIEAALSEQVVADIRAGGGEAIALPCDISSVEACERLVADTLAHYGRVEILVNNAGICPRIPVDEMTEAMFDRMMSINLKPIFFLTRAACNAMKAQQFGRVVNVSSTGGRIGGVHNATVYSATKGGVLAMTKSLARHYAPWNILINAVAPGAVNTRMFESVGKESLEAYVDTVPLKRLAEAEEIAQAIVPLCSASMTWVTGATLDVNGGVVMV
ncbi:MAG: glucose 1-dehydrogenase [Pleurocapsa minor GSE-CHR-MK-17-07R]|jgi:3-oxoacyl-[acyl-carrier protein] reductase|nr:glucose 1-dehydrogenase [Pleurocapsa minor GSE-CHR-MK 17-07R]